MAEAEMAKSNGLLRAEFDFDEQTVKPLLDGFAKEFPFVKEVKFASLQNVENYQVVFLELQAGRPPRMDLIGVASEFREDWPKAGVVVDPPVPYAELAQELPSGWPPLDQRGIDPNGRSVNIISNVRGIVYNHDLVPKEQAPKNWADCLRPEWKGKVVFETRIQHLPFMLDPSVRPWYTGQFLPAMKDQAVFVRGLSQSLESMASGEYLVHCSNQYNTTMRNVDRNKFPLTFVLPDPYPVELGVALHVPKGSPAPATAQLFAVYAATKGQEHVAKSWEELPWYPHGTLARLFTANQKAIFCDATCIAQGGSAQAEYAKILGLVGQ
jgi:ABC-type Fe3+ transport system substrate-binding protein